jgi:hypothetical protein
VRDRSTVGPIALDLGLFALDFELETGDDRRGERVNESADAFGHLR